MAQGLDLKSWNSDKSPSMDSKSGDAGKKARGVGSRRIFPPQFKLQVLDSYRNDVDCRGNQRATARKYNIHRRQIQKWLQCEHNLRTTVQENARNDLLDSKTRTKSDSQEDKTHLTLNQSATVFARLGDAPRPKENHPDARPESADDSKLDSHNLKRVAQKLYPSAPQHPPLRHPIPPPTAPNTPATRDDNFNRLLPEPLPDGPLDLKSKQTPHLPTPSAIDSAADEGPSPPPDRTDARHLPVPAVPDVVLKSLLHKYTGDAQGLSPCALHKDEGESLCSESVRRSESRCLSESEGPRECRGSWKRGPSEGREGCGDGTCRKKPKSEMLSRFDWSKSFSPKRKWMKASMQEMLEDGEQCQETSSLPIKQRVKLNLRSLPEATCGSEESNRGSGISSNFSIERLCASEARRESPWCGWRSWSEAWLPSRSMPSVVSVRVQPEEWQADGGSERLTPPEGMEVALKEEKISDSEDADIDILSTTPVEKKSFDLSSYSFGKRRSFSVQFKLTVLDAFYNDKDCNKNQRATARKFNINRRQVQKWLSQESDLRSEGSMKNGKYLQRQRLGGEAREAEGCARCPQHCLRKREVEEAFEKTIEVNVQHCSDNECLSRSPKGRLGGGVDLYTSNLFQSDVKSASFYQNYLFPENNNLIYHDSILGWPNLTTSALPVPNFQYLSTWHHNFDFCHENQKIY